MLDLRRLALLAAVARLGSISAAAAEAGCTASSASEQLTKLESEFGTALLERRARSVRLTAAGAELADQGRRILARADEIERSVKELAGLSSGRLKVASYQSGATRFVIPAITAFLRQRPQARVTFEEMEPEAGLAAVADGTVDIALVNSYLGLKTPGTDGVEIIELGRDPFVLAVPARLSITSVPVFLAEFADAPWISARPDTGFQAITELVAARAGFTPDVVARADSYDLVLDLVAGGMGVALIPASTVSTRASVRIYEPSESFDLARYESLVKRSTDRSSATTHLCELITKAFTKQKRPAPAQHGHGDRPAPVR